MIDVIQNKCNVITVSDCEFTVMSYKINHSRNYSKQFTVSGDICISSKGINPVSLNIKANCKYNNSSVVSTLENALISQTENLFEIDGLVFSDMILSEYSAENDKNNTISNIDMTFTSSENISEASSNE